MAEENEPGWYTPFQFNIPDYVFTTHKSLHNIQRIFQPLAEIQKTTLDIFAPIINAVNRKVDVFNKSIQFAPKKFKVALNSFNTE